MATGICAGLTSFLAVPQFACLVENLILYQNGKLNIKTIKTFSLIMIIMVLLFPIISHCPKYIGAVVLVAIAISILTNIAAMQAFETKQILTTLVLCITTVYTASITDAITLAILINIILNFSAVKAYICRMDMSKQIITLCLAALIITSSIIKLITY